MSSTRTPERATRVAASPPAGGSAAASGVTTALLLATAPSDEGGPAAGLGWRDEVVLGRLLEQLADLGLTDVRVVTRPDWVGPLEAAIDGAAPGVTVEASPDVAADLRIVAEAAGSAPGGIIVAYADIITHREALAGLLADPRIATGILIGGRRHALAFRIRTARGRVVGAASPYHAAHRPNGTFLGVLKVSATDRPALVDAAQRLERLVADGLPAGWEDELERKAGNWRARHEERTAAEQAEHDDEIVPHDTENDEADAPPPASEPEIARRLAAVREDVVSMLLVALVRSDVHLTVGHLRRLFWARPLSQEALAQATEDLGGFDEDAVLLESAVKARDGFFTTFFVSPYSKYLARAAARRGWTPNGVTTVSLLIGLLAAAAFATGERWGLVAGAVLLQLAFTTDCVDGQLARYTRTFSKLGAWLDSIFDRTKEYLVFAGLAIGSSAMGEPVWDLAGAALILQITRHVFDFSYAAGQHQLIGAAVHPPLEDPAGTVGGPRHAPAPSASAAADAATKEAPEPEPTPPLTLRDLPGSALRFWRRFDRLPAVAWIKRMVAFPIGERFAAISITAALFTPRTTFLVLLIWGGFAAVYTMAGRLLRSALPAAAAAIGAARGGRPTTLETYRDDGPLVRAIGALGRAVRLPGALLVALGALPVLVAIAAEGDGASDGLAAAVVAWFVVLGGLSAGRPYTRRLGWIAPAVLRATEYAAILWIGAVAGGASLAAAFALLCALAYRHYDLVYRLRHRGVTPPAWVDLATLGWDGRLILAVILLVAGLLPAGFFVAAALIGAIVVGDSVAGWVGSARRPRADDGAYDEEEDEGQ